MAKSKSKPPPSKPVGGTQATMWSTFGAAVERGWGATVRLILILMVVGAILVSIIAASGGSELPPVGDAVNALLRWARAYG